MAAPVVAWESMLVLAQAEPELLVREIMARRVEVLVVAGAVLAQSEAMAQTALLLGLAALV
jgi:hypothetical protein